MDTVVWLVAAPGARDHAGRILFDREPRRADLLPFTRGSERERQSLWRLCERVTATERA